jgi:hypothetical protein
VSECCAYYGYMTYDGITGKWVKHEPAQGESVRAFFERIGWMTTATKNAQRQWDDKKKT